MDKRTGKTLVTVVILGIVVLAMMVGLGIFIFKKYAPSLHQRLLSEQLALNENEALLVLNGIPSEQRAKFLAGKEKGGYVPVEFATAQLNQRLYWDGKEKVLSLATSQGLIQAGLDSNTYTLGKETRDNGAPVLCMDGETVCISLNFVGQYSRVSKEEVTVKDSEEGESARETTRILLKSDFTEVHTFARLADDVRLRVGPNKKYDYLWQLKKDQEVLVDTQTRAENEYQKIVTLDGLEGYVPIEYLVEQTEKAWEAEKEEDIFGQLGMEEKVCLGWHQMTTVVGAADLEAKVAQADSLNVVSPTWFALNDNKGNFTTLASDEYVTAAHAKGLKVWGLVNDFDKKISLRRILGRTSIRKNLINNLVSAAMRHNLDGINIDFEKITEKSAPAYLEFLRELVLVCHANNIVVSVDDYLPTDSSAFYDWREQGKVVDYVIFMAYDEHYAGSETSGSVSSLPFVESGVDLGLNYIPAERVVVALPFYTRLWKETKKEVTSSAYGMSSAESMLQYNGASPKWDDAASQYYAEFKSEGATYKIWLEEETSLEKKLEAVKERDVAGVAFWKLGFERPATWATIKKHVKK